MATNDFAKLYTTDRGQILVLLATDSDNNPEVRFFARPEELGVCSIALGWNDDSDAAWEKAEKAFEDTTEEKAVEMADYIYGVAKGEY